jgi:xylulokinase
MAEKQYVLGIDSSTSSTKAIVWDLCGQAVSVGRCPIPFNQPLPGRAEQDTSWWWESTAKAVQEALRSVDAASILAVGLTWQRESWVPLGAEGRPLRDAILWMDARGAEQVERMRAEYGDRFTAITGKPLDVTPSIFKIMWLREHEPEIWAETAAIVEVGGFLVWHLTGEFKTCSAGSDTMGLVDMRERDWSPEFVGYAGLTVDQLPVLVEPGELLGRLNSAGAQATGLLEGTPLIAGGGDGQCSAVGAGVLAPDVFGMSLGTGLSMNVHMPHYVFDRAFRTLIGCVPGTYLAEVNTRACSLIIQWFIREFGRIDKDLSTWMDVSVEEVLNLRISKVPPGSDGLLTLPFWRGAMMPHNKPKVRGAVLGWSDYHTKAHFYRSLLEGLAFEFRLKLEAIEAALDQACNAIHIAGGGAQSREWCQIISDITQKPVKIAASPESTCLGAAMLAATAAGAFPSLSAAAQAMSAIRELIEPLAQNRSLYDDIYKRVYVYLLPLLADTLEELREITTRE